MLTINLVSFISHRQFKHLLFLAQETSIWLKNLYSYFFFPFVKYRVVQRSLAFVSYTIFLAYNFFLDLKEFSLWLSRFPAEGENISKTEMAIKTFRIIFIRTARPRSPISNFREKSNRNRIINRPSSTLEVVERNWGSV